MTITEAIARIEELRPGAAREREVLRDLAELDGRVKREIIDTHEGGGDAPLPAYGEGTPLSTRLLVGAPHESIYEHYLACCIDYRNGDTERYNNAVTAFNAAFAAFAADYNRTHLPKRRAMRYL